MKSEIDDGLPGRIRECVAMAGSGAEMSRISGVPRRSLENYLTSVSEPKVAALAAIAVAVDVSLDWLVLGKGPKMRADEGGFRLQSHEARRFGRVVEAVEGVFVAADHQADGPARAREALRIYEKIWDLEEDGEFERAMSIFVRELERKLSKS